MKSRTSYINGTITLSGGTVVPFDDAILVKNTLYVENQCVNNNALGFGSVYAAECGFTLLTDIDRYKLFNAKIKFNHVIDGVSNNMGEFVAYDSNRVGTKVSIKALDHMTDFDVNVADIITGTPYELLKFFCDTVGVPLANTQEELNALVNGNYVYSINPVDTKTFRDGISYLCKVMCAFAHIDNLGRLKISQFDLNSTRTLEKENRLANCSFSDFETVYNGAKCRFLAEENFYPYDSIDEAKSGITMDLGDIPIVNLTADMKNTIIDNIAKYVSNIIYTPSELNVPGMSDLKLGAMIKCNNINNTSNSVNTIIMKYKWQYRQKEVLYSYGENPRLQNITQKTSGASGRTESAIASQKMVVNTAANIEDLSIRDSAVGVAQLGYTSASDCRPIIYAAVQFELDVDGNVVFELYNNGILLNTYKQYYNAGNNYALLMYVDDVAANTRNKLVLKCSCEYVESVERKQTALINKIKEVSKYSCGNLVTCFSEDWEQGGLDLSNGAEIEGENRIRSDEYISIAPNAKYKVSAGSYNYYLLGRLYDSNKSYIGATVDVWQTADYTFTTSADARYIRFLVKKSDNADILPANIYDTSFVVSPTYDDLLIDNAVPTMKCLTEDAHLVVYTQGIGTKIDWNGIIELTDRIGSIPAAVNVHKFTEALEVNQLVPQNCNITEAMNSVNINVEIVGFTDNVNVEVTDES